MLAESNRCAGVARVKLHSSVVILRKRPREVALHVPYGTGRNVEYISKQLARVTQSSKYFFGINKLRNWVVF